MARILVTGSKGMLGADLVVQAKRSHDVSGADLDEVDLTDREAVAAFVRDTGPETVINAAAYTDVDACETRGEEAFRVNAEAVENLAVACRDAGARMVHVSTDYVFDGTKSGPYREEDPTAPLGVYGHSKLEGERRLRAVLPEACIVRTAWLYGRGGKNFVKAIVAQADAKPTLRVVDDQRGSPTYTRDLARALVVAVERGLVGTYHVTNRGACTWFEFAVEILAATGRAHVEVLPITAAELGRAAPRPANSVLDTGKFERAAGTEMRPWQEALREYLSASG